MYLDWLFWYLPLRELYVSPAGGGDGLAIERPMSLANLQGEQQAGDRVWFLPGVYDGFTDTTIGAGGTAEAPVIWRGMGRVIVDGGISLVPAYLATWNMEFTDLENSSNTRNTRQLIFTNAAGAVFVNCIIHGAKKSKSGLGLWSVGADHVLHGSIIYDAGQEYDGTNYNHGVYAQNDGDLHGQKIITANMFMGNLPLGGSFKNFFGHGTSGSSRVTDMVVTDNIFGKSGMQVGKQAAGEVPCYRNKIADNVFVGVAVELGVVAGWQGEFDDNWILQADVDTGPSPAIVVWGEGESTYLYTGGTKVRRNRIVLLAGTTKFAVWGLSTNISGGTAGTVGIRDEDEWDGNVFYEPAGDGAKLRFPMTVPGFTGTKTGLSAWVAQTQLNGHPIGYDANSIVLVSPNVAMVWVRGTLEPGRAFVFIMAYGGESEVLVDLTEVLWAGQPFEVREPMDFWGGAVLSGVYEGGEILLPTRGLESYFVVVDPRYYRPEETSSVTAGHQPNVIVDIGSGASMYYYENQTVKLTGTFVDSSGVAIDPPTVTFVTMSPSGVVANLTYNNDPNVARSGPGVYLATVGVSEAGEWRYGVKSAGGNLMSASYGLFVVLPAPFG